MSRSAAALVLIVVLFGCGSKAKKGSRAPTEPVVVSDVGITVEEIRHDLEATMLENYSHLSLGNVDAYNDSIAREGTIVLFGPRGSDLVDAPPVKRDRRIYRDAELRYLSKNLEVRLLDSSRAAWVTDEISLRIPHEGREAALTLRYSAVLERSYGRWLIRAEHLSIPIAADRAAQIAEKGRLKFGRFIREEGKDAQLAVDIAKRLHEGDDEFRAAHLSDDGRSHAWLPGPRGELRGDELFDGYRFSAYAGSDASIERVGAAGGLIGAELAWVAEQIRVRPAEGPELPLRVLSVFERRDGRWLLVHAHTSVPLMGDDIDALLF